MVGRSYFHLYNKTTNDWICSIQNLGYEHIKSGFKSEFKSAFNLQPSFASGPGSDEELSDEEFGGNRGFGGSRRFGSFDRDFDPDL